MAIIIPETKKYADPTPHPERGHAPIMRINECLAGVSKDCPHYFTDETVRTTCDLCERILAQATVKALKAHKRNGNLPPGVTRLKKACEKPVTFTRAGNPVSGQVNLIVPSRGSRRIVV